MSQIFVVVKDGKVIECIACNGIADLADIYTDCQIIERTGDETIGWNYDGVNFTPPVGG